MMHCVNKWHRFMATQAEKKKIRARAERVLWFESYDRNN